MEPAAARAFLPRKACHAPAGLDPAGRDSQLGAMGLPPVLQRQLIGYCR
jgi:hypothetical protein